MGDLNFSSRMSGSYHTSYPVSLVYRNGSLGGAATAFAAAVTAIAAAAAAPPAATSAAAGTWLTGPPHSPHCGAHWIDRQALLLICGRFPFFACPTRLCIRGIRAPAGTASRPLRAEQTNARIGRRFSRPEFGARPSVNSLVAARLSARTAFLLSRLVLAIGILDAPPIRVSRTRARSFSRNVHTAFRNSLAQSDHHPAVGSTANTECSQFGMVFQR